MLSSNISHTFPYNMVNFSPLEVEIVSLVWGTQANFNGFRVLAALLHSQTTALNRGRHLYSAGRPSRWALAHISICCFINSSLYTGRPERGTIYRLDHHGFNVADYIPTRTSSFLIPIWLWSPYGIGQTIIFSCCYLLWPPMK